MILERGEASDADLIRRLIHLLRWVRGAGPPPSSPLAPAYGARLVGLADAHRVLAMLHPHERALQPFLPAPVLAAAARDYRYNAVRQMRQRVELRRLLALLAGAGLAVAPIKGLALSDTVYPDAAVRRTSDLDLLITPPDFQKALLTLIADGYRDAEPTLRGSHLNRGLGIELLHPAADDLHIDLHRVLGLGHRSLTGQMLLRATPATLAGGPARLLAPEDLLILLCLHLWKHGLSQLRWFVDIAETLRRFDGQLDWRRVAGIASEAHVAMVVGVVLRRTQEYLGVDLPPGAGRALGFDRAPIVLVHAALQAHGPPPGYRPPSNAHRLGDFVFQLTAAGPDDHARPRAVVRALWPSPATFAALNAAHPDRLPARTRVGRLWNRLAFPFEQALSSIYARSHGSGTISFPHIARVGVREQYRS